MLVNEVYVFDGVVRMIFVKSVFIIGGLWPGLRDYGRAWNVTRPPNVEGGVKRKENV